MSETNNFKIETLEAAQNGDPEAQYNLEIGRAHV